MRLLIRNVVTLPAFAELRKRGAPVFKPLICGQTLLPNNKRIIELKDLSESDILFLESLVKSGSCTAMVIGQGPVDFEELKSIAGVKAPEPVVAPAPEPAVEIEEIIEEEPVVHTESEEVDPEVNEEEMEEEPSSGYTEQELSDMKNADLRELALSIDGSASVANKSKRKLVSLIMELQNG